MKYIILLMISISSVITVPAQPSPFKIAIEPVEIPGLKGIQSYAYGQAGGKWLIIGGRTDGLHMRQPFGAFRPAGKNVVLTVIDPISYQKWESSITTLATDLKDQLSSTNMQFLQNGKFLYLVGGYGHSESSGKFTTYDKLTVVNVSNTIDAVINSKSLQPFFRQIADSAFAVTGGHLKKMGDTYFLVGGHKFIGRYNPMGPDHGPGFFQQYTDQVRKFSIADDGKNISISNYETITDADAFHRRDYNVVPQVLPGGEEALSVFSGVFQKNARIPFLNSVTIAEKSYAIDYSFAQYYNHYHSAVLPVYSSRESEMHNIIFGGIAQYYDSADVLVQSDEVPFVKTISRVTRNKEGQLAEFKLPVEMPALLGAGSEFILLPAVPHYSNKVVKLDELSADTTLAGHIYGGIVSSLPNVFFINTGEQSYASNKLFKVYIIKNTAADEDKLNVQSNNGLQLQVFPDVAEKKMLINFTLAENTTIEIDILNNDGKVLKNKILKKLNPGAHSVTNSIKAMRPGDVYWVSLKLKNKTYTQKIKIEE